MNYQGTGALSMNINISIVVLLVVLVMFIIMFVYVLRIWHFHQQILHSGGYPALTYSRAKRDANSILEGRAPWDFENDEIIEILSHYPDNPEAADLVHRLTAQKNEVDKK
jgi:hypothetical protein